MFKDWFKKSTSDKPESRKSLVLEAGIPPEERVDQLPLSEAQFLRHFNGFGELPDDPQLQNILLRALQDPGFLLDLPRGTAQRLLSPGGALADSGLEQDSLLRFLNLMHGEITRAMYIKAARDRVGARGIRFLLPENVSVPEAERAVVEGDTHGLGAGGYPFDAIPENPHPGQPARYYVRVILDEPS